MNGVDVQRILNSKGYEYQANGEERAEILRTCGNQMLFNFLTGNFIADSFPIISGFGPYNTTSI